MIQREKRLVTKIRPDMYFLLSARSMYIYNFTCIYMYIFSRKQTIYDLTQITRFNLIQVQIFFCRFEQIKSKLKYFVFPHSWNSCVCVCFEKVVYRSRRVARHAGYVEAPPSGHRRHVVEKGKGGRWRRRPDSGSAD